MIARGAALLGALALTGPAMAHDFWIQPDRWTVRAGEPVGLELLVGHGGDRQRSPIARSRIVRLEAIAARGVRADLRGSLRDRAAPRDATFVPAAPGLYVMALETDATAESHLPPDRFDLHVASEGLTPARGWRRRARNATEASENYSRHAKAVVRVGPVDRAAAAVAARPVGMALEIVPDRDTLATPSPARLTLRILYRGRPLPGARVKLTDLAHDAAPVATAQSGAGGRVAFAAPGAGDWLVTTVWTRAQPRRRLTDFETRFASLAFHLDR